MIIIKIKKDKMFMLGNNTMDSIRDGESFILIKSRKNQPPDSIQTVDFTETDHSTSSQDCLREEPSPLPETILSLES